MHLNPRIFFISLQQIIMDDIKIGLAKHFSISMAALFIVCYVIGHESDKFCRLRKKTKPVILVCQNFQHKDALCKDCTRKVKTSLMGPAGQFASTNIYDFTVRKVDFEGRIHLFHMACRRPPQQAIHWKTTNRLTLSSLVATVKVPESNFGLKANDPIIWGEITVHDQSKDEFKRREKGELVVSDLGDLKDKCDLHQGDNVVIIDCKTLVPEHIPVLKAVEELQLSTLPFNDGIFYYCFTSVWFL